MWYSPSAKKLIHLSLFIPMLVHGFWNWSDKGLIWWQMEYGRYSFARFLVAAIEIIGGFGILLGFFRRQFAAILAIVMAGAVMVHFDRGFSFKNNGYETPLIYLLVCLALYMEKSEPHEK
jgi:uncharacterized membrane protein YphA (DoxX/SURF4 family)